MLSRIAESLFWIGRYCERAEDTARLLQVQLRHILEDPGVVEEEVCRDVLTLMEAEVPQHPRQDDLLRILGYDGRQPSSIVASWVAARDNARRAREVIPLELWGCINTTWHQLPTGRFDPARASWFLDWARERSALFTGIARGTMVRDDGWQFLLLGRSLEQADMTSRQVAATSTASAAPWPVVLRGCGAHDAFLRTYRGFHADREAAEFVILDARFPRSVMHGLLAAAECLARITRVNPSREREISDAVRVLGQLTARLRYARMDDLLGDLDHEMTAVQDACAFVAGAVSTSFFAVKDVEDWVTEGAR